MIKRECNIELVILLAILRSTVSSEQISEKDLITMAQGIFIIILWHIKNRTETEKWSIAKSES